jgi:hypothetical protein
MWRTRSKILHVPKTEKKSFTFTGLPCIRVIALAKKRLPVLKKNLFQKQNDILWFMTSPDVFTRIQESP